MFTLVGVVHTSTPLTKWCWHFGLAQDSLDNNHGPCTAPLVSLCVSQQQPQILNPNTLLVFPCVCHNNKPCTPNPNMRLLVHVTAAPAQVYGVHLEC
jgi:hypothetical protein